MDLQKILEEQGWRYEGTPTIQPGMTMDQYRQRGGSHEVTVRLKIKDHNKVRALSLVRRLLKRSSIEIVGID